MSDAALVLICGDEPYLVDASAKEWRTRAASAQLEVEIFDAPTKLEGLARALAEVPMFDPERVVVLRDPPQLGVGARRGADSAETLLAALANRAPTTAVCIVNHAPLAATHPIREAVAKLGGEVIEHRRLRGRELRMWLETEARNRDLRLAAAGIEHLLATVDPDLGMLAGELDKLAAFAAGSPIAHSDLVRLVAGDVHVEIWNVIEWLLGPSPGRGVAAVDALLAEGRPAAYLIASFAGQVRDLVAVRALLSEKRATSAAVASALRLPSWRADRLVRQARRLPGRVSVGWLRELQQIDTATKAGEVDDAEALRIFARRAAATLAG